MNEIPSQAEIDEVYSALYELFQKYMIYGVPKPTLLNVLEFWNELGKELEEYRSIAENIGAVKAVSEKEKVIPERDDFRDVLSEISLYLSVGMGDETTTAKQYHDRILEGIKMLTDPLQDRIKELEEK